MTEKDNMTYTLRLKMDGQFPGAPDYDEWVITKETYDFALKGYNALKLEKLSDSDPLSCDTPAPEITADEVGDMCDQVAEVAAAQKREKVLKPIIDWINTHRKNNPDLSEYELLALLQLVEKSLRSKS